MSHQFPALWILMSVGERYKIIDSVDGAAQLLIDHWPSHAGYEYVGALAVCRDALLGAVPASDAREALIRAADEALISYICVIDGGRALGFLGGSSPAGRRGSKTRFWFGNGVSE
jgi:hypothetical protein